MRPLENHSILPYFTKFWIWPEQEAAALHKPQILVSETANTKNVKNPGTKTTKRDTTATKLNLNRC